MKTYQKLIFSLSLVCSLSLADNSVYLPNLKLNATGSSGGGKNALDVNIASGGTSPASVGTVGSPVPSSADYVGFRDVSGNLAPGNLNASGAIKVDGSAVTQPVSAASLPLPAGAATSAKQPALGTAGSASSDVLSVQGIASMTALKVDGSAVTQPVSGAFFQSTQPVSAASLPLPTGASTAAKQPALGTAGSASSDVITIQGIASMTALKVDGSAVVQPASQSGTWNMRLQDGAGSAVNKGQTTASGSLPVTIASDQVAPKTYANSSGSFVLNSSLTTVVSEAAPSGAVGFILETSSSNASNVRWALGATATTSSGMRLEPGRDTGFVPVAATISIVAEAGTQEYQLTWIKQ